MQGDEFVYIQKHLNTTQFILVCSLLMDVSFSTCVEKNTNIFASVRVGLPDDSKFLTTIVSNHCLMVHHQVSSEYSNLHGIE